MARAKNTDAPKVLADLAKLGLQRFTLEKVRRDALVDAPYNPRIMAESAKRKLKNGLGKHGMVAPLTWNKRTGHIVGGHQRLAILDTLAGTKDYELEVAAIDVDETAEMEINLLLNNQEAAGDWDLDALGKLLKDNKLIDISGAGFDQADVYKMFGYGMLEDRDDPLDELAAQVRKANDLYKEMGGTSNKRNQLDFYIVVIFRDDDDVSEFLKKHGLPDNRFQSGEEISRMMVDQNAKQET